VSPSRWPGSLSILLAVLVVLVVLVLDALLAAAFAARFAAILAAFLAALAATLVAALPISSRQSHPESEPDHPGRRVFAVAAAWHRQLVRVAAISRRADDRRWQPAVRAHAARVYRSASPLSP